jgi:hypothetical protein
MNHSTAQPVIAPDSPPGDARQPVESISFIASIRRAVVRARWCTLSVVLTYAVSLFVGMLMVHTGNSYALNQRDAVVSKARAGDTLVALQQNDRLRASLLDFAGNLFLGADPNTIQGIEVIGP